MTPERRVVIEALVKRVTMRISFEDACALSDAFSDLLAEIDRLNDELDQMWITILEAQE